MKVPYLDLPAQDAALSGEIMKALQAICQSARFAQGPPTREFERDFAAYCGVAHCVSVNSGTSALHLALRCLDIGPGDEVITVPFTFIATAWAISYVGAKPIFVDIDPIRRTLDPVQLEVAITPRTKAILPVHLFGVPADMEAILAVARRHGIPVVEDASQAHGARYRNRSVGRFGVMAGFSFYPGKNLGAYGEGGALVTDDPALARRAASLREHAQEERYHHMEIGYNYRMDSFQGAVLDIKLKHLDAWNKERRQIAARYSQLLHGSRYRLPVAPEDSEPVWHCYVIEADDRDRVRERLLAAGVETGIHYPIPLHLQPAYAFLNYRPGNFPASERIARGCLSLPIYPGLSDAAVEHIAATLKAI
jgi:dTDP-4-amino-4,6-dideoxygalactose transaminase